jgi:hypothetical protein
MYKTNAVTVPGTYGNPSGTFAGWLDMLDVDAPESDWRKLRQTLGQSGGPRVFTLAEHAALATR